MPKLKPTIKNYKALHWIVPTIFVLCVLTPLHITFSQEAGWNPNAIGSALGGKGLPDPRGGLFTILLTFINWAIIIIGLLGVIAFIYGGFVYLTAQAESRKLEQAKKIIIYAVVGIVVAILGLVAVRTIDSLMRGNVGAGSVGSSSQQGNSLNSGSPNSGSPGINHPNGNGGNGWRGSGGNGAMGNVTAGKIVSIEGSKITVEETAGQTKIVEAASSTISKSVKGTTADLKIGVPVMVSGQTNPNGSLSAGNIRINPIAPGSRPGDNNGSAPPKNDNREPRIGQPRDDNRGFIFGEITSTDSSNITVQDQNGNVKTINVPATVQISKTENASIADLKTGEVIFSNGSNNPDGSLSAQDIQVRPVGN